MVKPTGVSLGDTAIHFCPEHSVQVGNETKSECLASGLWSDVNISCKGTFIKSTFYFN